MEPRYFLVLAVALIMGWFAIGILYNIRRGNQVLRWMEKGLPRIGERTTFRWLGSSVAELVIAQAKDPTRRVEILIVLAPRDVPWNWLFAVLRGRHDVLILRADLNSAPRLALELSNPKTWTGRMSLDVVRQEGWQSQEYLGQTLMAPAGLLKMAAEFLSRLQQPAKKLSPRYDRFSLRKDTPHLEVHIPFPDTKRDDAMAFFIALQDLARAIHQPGQTS